MSWGSSWLKEQKAREFLVEKLVLCHNERLEEAIQRKKEQMIKYRQYHNKEYT